MSEARYDNMKNLQDGWMDGKGIAIDCTALTRLIQMFDEHFSSNLPMPYMYPTLEGGVQAEWTIGNWEVSLEINLSSFLTEYHAVNIVSRETHELSLILSTEDDNYDWTILNNTLSKLNKYNVKDYLD